MAISDRETEKRKKKKENKLRWQPKRQIPIGWRDETNTLLILTILDNLNCHCRYHHRHRHRSLYFTCLSIAFSDRMYSANLLHFHPLLKVFRIRFVLVMVLKWSTQSQVFVEYLQLTFWCDCIYIALTIEWQSSGYNL